MSMISPTSSLAATKSRSSDDSAMARCERHAHFERNQLRQLVGQSIRLALNARNVAHDRLRRHRAERHDLAHRFVSVAFGHVRDHRVAADHAEVDVEVRHRYAFGIQQSFEQQVVRERIEIRDAERVRNERTRARATSGANRNSLRSSPS